MRSRLVAVVAILAVVALVAVGVQFVPATVFSTGAPQDTAQVTTTRDDATLATVRARVADTPDERVQGLSGVPSLPNGTGMLFVYSSEAQRTYVMRDMRVPLDMVFVGGDGRITRIFHAPTPPPETDEANLTRYTARAQWVLEVPRGWAAAHDVRAGDRIRIEYGVGPVNYSTGANASADGPGNDTALVTVVADDARGASTATTAG